MIRAIILSVATLALALFTPIQAHAITGAYAALGDSVAAGSGLAGNAAPCHQSTEAYGYAVGQSLGLPIHHLACIGAKSDEGLYGSQERDGVVLPAQIDQAFVNGKPELISITIGANDARWTQFIRQCYYITCGYEVDAARYAAYLADLKLELNIAMAQIHRLSNGVPPRVIVTGYYQPFSTAICDDTAALTEGEMLWLNDRTAALNRAISGTVGKYSFAHYVPVSFAGHELCSSDPWIQGPTDSLPFHPTATGQQAIAAAVLNQHTQQPTPSSSLSLRERALDWLSRYQGL